MQDSARSKEGAGAKNRRAPHKKSPIAPGATVRELLRPWQEGQKDSNIFYAAKYASEAFGHLKPGQLTPMMCAALVADWRKRFAATTAYKYRHHLRQILRWMEAQGAPRIDLPTVPKPSARAVTASPDELAKLFASPAPFLRLFMLLYFQCGLRLAETLEVTPYSWNPAEHTVVVPTKGGRWRSAEVTPEIEALFLAGGPALTDKTPFIHILHGGPISKCGVTQAFTTHKKKCGISENITPHDLRRTAATILYQATKDLRVPQQLLGHKNLQSTLTYLAPMAPDEARKYAELLRFDRFRPKEGDKPS